MTSNSAQMPKLSQNPPLFFTMDAPARNEHFIRAGAIGVIASKFVMQRDGDGVDSVASKSRCNNLEGVFVGSWKACGTQGQDVWGSTGR